MINTKIIVKTKINQFNFLEGDIIVEIIIKLCYELEKKLKNYDKKKGIVINLDKPVNIKYLIANYFSKDMKDAMRVVLANKKIVDFNYQVKDGDIIEIFPLLGGG